MIIAKISEATWAIVLLMTLVTFPSNAETAIPTEELLDKFFGVNLHLDNCCDGNYGDLNRVVSEIRYIGARRLRDWTGTHKGLLAKWQQVHRETGLTFNASIPNGSPEYQRKSLSVMQDWLQQNQGMIKVIEGSNEPDMPYSMERKATLEDSAELQQDVYKVGKAAGVMVGQLSVGGNWKAPLWEGNYKSFGKPPADLGNAHVYMNPLQPPSEALSRIGKLAAWSVDDKPVEVTEFGVYKTSLQDDDVVSAFMHIAPFSSYLLGHAGLMVYALHDDMTGIVGFYDKYGKERPFAKYWHVTTRLLSDPDGRNLPRKEIGVQVSTGKKSSNKTYGVKYVVLYKSDGSSWLAIFNEGRPDAQSEKATVEFSRSYQSIKLIDARSGNEVKKYEDKTKIDVNLPANHLFLIEAR